jgi:glycosyltransferase involved in cell wall biosynthesis
MKKILCINHSCSLHGAERVFLAGIRACLSAGCGIWVAVPSGARDDGLLHELEPLVGKDHILRLPYKSAGGSLFRTLLVRLYNLPAVWRLSRFIRRQSMDCIYSNTSVTIAGVQTARWTGLEHFWHFHESVTPLSGWTPALQTTYRQWIARTRTTLLFISQRQRREWEEALGCRPQGHLIYNPVCLMSGKQPPVRHTALRIGYIGRFVPLKNIPLLVEAFLRFRKRHPDSELWLCGALDEREKTEWERRCGSGHGIRILLQTDDAESFYRQMDILALPSLRETMPLVTIEAMSAGVCVIQTTQSGMSELYEDGEDCLFVAPEHAEDWENAFEACADQAFRTRLARNGQTKTLQYAFNRQFETKIKELICVS